MDKQRLLIKRMFRELSQGLARDQAVLRRGLQRVQRHVRTGRVTATELEDLKERLAASRHARQKRLLTLPTPTYSDVLPVAQQRDHIARMVQQHPVVVLCGETGSGKTTQLPKICLDLKRGTSGWIGVTQPRRIAARSIADFLAQDLKSEIGGIVGYKMRFNDRVSPDSYVKVMTDGILLAEIQHDRMLSQYDTLIIDEAHERSLNIDFILGILKQLVPKRPELKVIISSATLDTQRFSHHFHNAPIIEVSGRTYPVEVRYRPLQILKEDEAGATDRESGRKSGGEEGNTERSEERDVEQGVLEAVQELCALGPSGDILVFLPGEREIRDIAAFLRKNNLPHVEIFPLFARLSMADQHRIFRPGKQRRIVLATNVAETSITVPGIRYVIDSGMARVSRHSGRTQVRRLPVEKISRAAANQRQGRCGRVADGVCIRLFSEEDFLARTPFTDPEIVRSSLANVILQMTFLKLGEVESFPFVDPPNPHAIRDGRRLLTELGALTEAGKLTQTGREMAQLPLDPRLGRMILAGHRYRSLHEMVIIVSAMNIPDPRERPDEQRGKAEAAHKRHHHPRSDFVTILNVWRFIQAGQAEAPSKAGFRRFLKENFLSFIRVREWQGIQSQLIQMAKQLGWKSNSNPASFEDIHKAILAGSLSFIGFKTENRDYLGAKQNRFHISPGSVLFKKSPTWVVAGELTETTRMFARTCAQVEPEWIEEVAGALCRRSHYDPHWEKKSGSVWVFERVTLFGLILMAQRKVPFGCIDAVSARQIFIQSALVEGRFQTSAPFFGHNQGLIAEVRELEHKSRRRDLLVDEQDIFHFYDGLVPEDVYDARRFHHWYRRAQREQPRLLFFSRDMLLRHVGEAVTGESFPGHLTVQGQALSLEYHFNPGDGEDGISVRIPLPFLNQLPASPFEWLVPGLLPNKVLALLKTLPKTLRRPLVPLPQAAQYCQDKITAADGGKPLTAVLGRIIAQRYAIDIPSDAWRAHDLPDHLNINFKIIDEHSEKVLAQGRDLVALRQAQGMEAKKRFDQLPKTQYERSGLTRWSFGSLPRQLAVQTEEAGMVYGFPAIQDDGSTVSLRLLDDPVQAQHVHRWGLVRLFALQLRQQVRALEKNMRVDQAMVLAYAPLGRRDRLLEELAALSLARVFLDVSDDDIHDEAGFQKRLQAGRSQLAQTAQEMGALVRCIMQPYQTVLGLLRAMKAPAVQPVVTEVRAHLDNLVFPGFLRATPPAWLPHLPRYLQAICLRLERRPFAPQKDQQRMDALLPLWRQYEAEAKKQVDEKREDPALQRYRWMLEEYRVSLFAQDLRTAMPVSPKRLQAQWEQVLK